MTNLLGRVRWARHEQLFLGLGALTILALLVRAGPAHIAVAEVVGLTVGYAVAVVALAERFPRLRFFVAYLFALGFYSAVVDITPALGFPLRDGALLAVDRALFGESPAVSLSGVLNPLATDVFSACYLGYHVWVHGALLWALRVRRKVAGPAAASSDGHLAACVLPLSVALPQGRARSIRPGALAIWPPAKVLAFGTATLRRPLCPVGGDAELLGALFCAFAVGYVGYLLVPAIGPDRAFPELFPTPLAGGLMTQVNHAVIGRGTCVYDVFPSLHTLIPLVLLEHDWRRNRRRFKLLLPLALGLFASTILLRYHYAVDLLAAVAAFWISRWIRGSRTGDAA